MPKLLTRWWLIYVAIFCVFAVFSYGLTAPNLILTSWQPYWDFQWFMWRTFFDQRQVLASTYLAILGLMFVVYFVLLRLSRHKTLTKDQLLKGFLPWLLILLVPTFVSFNALSYDVFNYMFNAKIIAVYQGDPVQKAALDYPDDPWLKFMHNVHTATPYGRGWNILSLIPFAAGFGKLLPTWLLFKALGPLALVLLFFIMWYWWKAREPQIPLFEVLLLFANPVMLLEFGSSSHNDIWMMLPAVLSFVVLARKWQKNQWLMIAASLALLLLSISIKYVTILLIPIWLVVVLIPWIKQKNIATFLKDTWSLAAVLALFVPLLTQRSQWFHPWYMGWLLVWLPFLPTKSTFAWVRKAAVITQVGLLCFSISSLLRYLPWMSVGGYPTEVILNQRYITFSAIPLTLIVLLGLVVIEKHLKKS